MANAFDQFDAPSGGNAFDQFDEPKQPDDHGLAERQSRSWVGRTLAPITDYPKHYAEMRKEATGLMGEGLHQMTHPDSLTSAEGHGLWDLGAGAVKTGLGAAGYVASPISAAYRSFLGQPVEDVTGIPREYTEFAAQLATPGLGLKGLPGSNAPNPTPGFAKTLPPRTIGDFNVPLTEGEATGNMGKIAFERRALRNGEGEPAQKAAQDFMDERDAALAQARSDISEQMYSRRRNVAETPQEAGDIAGQGIRREADALRQQRNDAYEEMRTTPGEIDPAGFRGIAQSMRGELSQGTSPVIIDEVKTPWAAEALADVDRNIDKLRIPNQADPYPAPNAADLTAPHPDQITGISLQGIDEQRKRLISFYKNARTYPPDADSRATQAVIHAFDNHVQQAIDAGLFSGDPRAIEALREARAAHSQYMRTFTQQGSTDDVGRVMQHIIGSEVREPATPTEVANYLFGASEVGAKGLSVRLADRVRDVLGPRSARWAAVKQGAWRKLTEKPEGVTQWGPEQVSNRIYKFLNGDGQPLANRMFSKKERDLMERYADLLKETVPPPGAVNYSNNVPMLASLRATATRAAMALFGSHIGGVVGGVVGTVGALAATPIRNAMTAAKVRQQMPGFQESMRRWNQAMATANRNPNSTFAKAQVTARAMNVADALRKLGVPDAELPKMPAAQSAAPPPEEHAQGGIVARRVRTQASRPRTTAIPKDPSPFQQRTANPFTT